MEKCGAAAERLVLLYVGLQKFWSPAEDDLVAGVVVKEQLEVI